MLLYKMLRKYIKAHLAMAVFFIIFNTISLLLTLITPYLSGKYIDILIRSNNIQNLYKFCILFIIVSLGSIVITYYKNIIITKLKNKVAYELSCDIIAHISFLPLLYINTYDSVYLSQKVNYDANIIATYVIENIINIFLYSLMIFLIIFYLISINPIFLIIALIFIAIYLYLYFYYKKPLYNKSLLFKEMQNLFLSKFNEQINKIKVIKINSWFKEIRLELDKSFNDLFMSAIKYAKTSFQFDSSNSLVKFTFGLILYIYCGFEVIENKITIGTLIIVNNFFSILISLINSLLTIGKSYQDALSSYKRIMDILKIKVENNGHTILNCINKIKLVNVNFSYDDKRKIIKNLNYEFSKGNIYCITGKNGQGKSTLLNIIIGILQNYDGNIYINSTNINEIDLYELRKHHIAVVDQEPVLFNSSILDNLTYGLKRFNIKDIDTYCNLFRLDNLIRSLPKGYNTIIEDKSNNISGGEKQKLSLIRCLIKNPDLIILDEPTSALDNYSKYILLSILDKIKINKIIIIITHDTDITNFTNYKLEL